MNCVILYDILTYDPQKNVLHFFQYFFIIRNAVEPKYTTAYFYAKKEAVWSRLLGEGRVGEDPSKRKKVSTD